MPSCTRTLLTLPHLALNIRPALPIHQHEARHSPSPHVRWDSLQKLLSLTEDFSPSASSTEKIFKCSWNVHTAAEHTVQPAVHLHFQRSSSIPCSATPAKVFQFLPTFQIRLLVQQQTSIDFHKPNHWILETKILRMFPKFRSIAWVLGRV